MNWAKLLLGSFAVSAACSTVANSPKPMLGTSGQSGVVIDPTPSASAATPAPTSGTRLKAKVLVAEDGSRQQLFGWHDSQTGEDCAFRTAEDGRVRCLPAASPTLTLYFADDKCTVPLYGQSKAGAPGVVCPPALPVTLTVADQCTDALTRYDVAPEVGPVATFQKLGTCIAVAATTVDYLEFHAITNPRHLPAEMFVAATEQLE